MRKIFVFILTLLLTLPILSTAKQSTAPRKDSQQKVYAKKNAKHKAYVRKDKKKAYAKKDKKRKLARLLALPILSTAKQSIAPKKNSQQKTYVKKKTKQKAYAKKNKKLKLVKKQRVRFAHRINKPQEGETLKIEGMTKDINEQ